MTEEKNQARDQYIQYLREHIDNVKKAYSWLVEHEIVEITPSEEMFQNVLNQHDASKYSPEEFQPYVDYFFGERDELVKARFNLAWLHHIHENPHHWQHWVLIEDGEAHPLNMPLRYIVEMVCDWWAFSFKKGDLKEIFNWYRSNATKMILHPETRKTVELILGRIKEELDKEEK